MYCTEYETTWLLAVTNVSRLKHSKVHFLPKRGTNYPLVYWCPYILYVAVPGRIWTLFCCIFWSCYCVQSTVAQNFRLGRGSYALRRHVRSCIYAALMSPASNRSSALQRFKCSNAIKIRNRIMFDLYLGLHVYRSKSNGAMVLLFTVNELMQHPLFQLDPRLVNCPLA